MSLPQHIPFEVGGTLTLDVVTRPSNALVTISTGDGATLISNATATVESVVTIVTNAVTAGNTVLNLANASTLVSGGEFWLRTPDEKCRVKSVSGNAVTLWHPVLQSHANGVAVEGTRLSYAVPAANATPLFWDGRVDWCLNSATHIFSAVECTKYGLERLATVQDLYAEHPLLNHVLDSQEDAEKLLDTAHADVLARIGGKARVRVYTGSQEFIRATVFCALHNHYRRQGTDRGKAQADQYAEELDAELQRIVQLVPRDEDQDGKVTAQEQFAYRSVRLYRR